MTTLVLIPGIQGRWEWMTPTIAALRRHVRVLTFSLNEIDAAGLFENCARHVDRLLDEADVTSAAIAGVSFGGLVAVHYAASRPRRVSRLILTSTPSPRQRLDPASARYVRRPRLSLPAFALRAVPRVGPEILASVPDWPGRARFAAGHVARVVRYPLAPRLMAAWVDAWQTGDLAAQCRRVSAPTLLVTGEAALDRVVPVASSLDYLTLIPGARHVTLPRTGHLGIVTRPDAWADIVSDFVGADGRAG